MSLIVDITNLPSMDRYTYTFENHPSLIRQNDDVTFRIWPKVFLGRMRFGVTIQLVENNGTFSIYDKKTGVYGRCWVTAQEVIDEGIRRVRANRHPKHSFFRGLIYKQKALR